VLLLVVGTQYTVSSVDSSSLRHWHYPRLQFAVIWYSLYHNARFTHTVTSRELHKPLAMWTNPEHSAMQFCTCCMCQPIHALAHCTWPDCLSVPGLKRPECQDIHSPPPSVEVKNEWSYTSAPIQALITCTLASFLPFLNKT
jgi:hypothetical protein